MTETPGGPDWQPGTGDDETPPTAGVPPFGAPAPAGGPLFAPPTAPAWSTESAGADVPPPPPVNVTAESSGAEPHVDLTNLSPGGDLPHGSGLEDAPGRVLRPNGPLPLFAADQGDGVVGTSTTRTIDDDVWTSPDLEEPFAGITAKPAGPGPIPPAVTADEPPATAKAKKSSKRGRKRSAGGDAAAPKPKEKPKGKTQPNSNLPKLLAALGVTVVIAAIAMVLMNRSNDESEIDLADDPAVTDTVGDSTVDGSGGDGSTSGSADPGESMGEGGTDGVVTDPSGQGSSPDGGVTGDTGAVASPGDEDTARALLARIWANATAKRAAHEHLLADIEKLRETGETAPMRVSAAAAAQVYREEAALWSQAVPEISALGDPYRTSMLMLKRANDVMLQSAEELTACENCTYEHALSLARNGERLTSDGMADIIAILPPDIPRD